MSSTILNPNNLPVKYHYIDGVNGSQSVIGTGSNTFTAIGGFYLTTGDYPSYTTYTFEVIVEATTGMTAEVRLYNITDAAVVSSSTLSTSANVATYVSGNITPTSGSKVYEVQLRITAGSPTSSDGATCKSARLKIKLI